MTTGPEKKSDAQKLASKAKVRRVDDRVRNQIEKAVASRHRCLIALVGDESKTQVMNLHYMLTKARGAADNELSVLWCMKKDLAFGGMSRKRRLEQNKKEKLSGRIVSENTHDNFENFLSQAKIRFCYYKETKKVLGSTYDIAILQDFEAITPNILARVAETVSGQGILLLMVRTLASLEHLHCILHAETTQNDAKLSFGARLLHSLADCENFLCVDDGLNILPITKKLRREDTSRKSRIDPSLKQDKLLELKKNIATVQPGAIASLCMLTLTYDQCLSFLTLVKTIASRYSDATKRRAAHGAHNTIAITSSRGRGKSAALGLAIAFALYSGLKRIYILAPCLESLVALFDFVSKGLNALGYSEHADYDREYGEENEGGSFVRAVRFFGKRDVQQITFLHPREALTGPCSYKAIANCDMLVLDEGAVLPLHLVQSVMHHSALTMISSTVAGYEGSGRSLAIKLLKSLEAESQMSLHAAETHSRESFEPTALRKSYQHVQLHEPIRYASGDPIEQWLQQLLCLPCGTAILPADTEGSDLPSLQAKPHPDKCELKYISKDSLFQYSALSEKYLRRIMLTLFHAHYRNQPDDLQILCESENHHIFVLVGPEKTMQHEVPDILCVLQIVQEGGIDRKATGLGLQTGSMPSGNMIPYTLAQYFNDPALAEFYGVRIIRIATHPEAQRCGYGSQAISQLMKIISTPSSAAHINLANGLSAPWTSLAIFLEKITYVGTMFGATSELFQFWSRSAFYPVYLRQTQNEMTGEHSLLMIHSVNARRGQKSEISEGKSMRALRTEFIRRYVSLLPSVFRHVNLELSALIALSLPKERAESERLLLEAQHELTSSDISRLRRYIQLQCDFGLIADLIPRLAKLYFSGAFTQRGTEDNISALTLTIFLAVGLHGYALDELVNIKPFEGSSVSIGRLKTLLTQVVEKCTRMLCRRLESDMPVGSL